MKWPFVSRARFDERVASEQGSADSWRTAYYAECERRTLIWQDARRGEARYDALMEKYHALRVSGANAPEPIAPIPAPVEPEMPPPAVLAAIQQISPTRDRTYDANWAYWEQNKDKAAQHPEAFAEEILAGLSAEVDWTLQTR